MGIAELGIKIVATIALGSMGILLAIGLLVLIGTVIMDMWGM
jgi:hypothetical protein